MYETSRDSKNSSASCSLTSKLMAYLWELKPKLRRTCTFFRDLNSVDTGKVVQKLSQQTEQFKPYCRQMIQA